MRVTHLWRYPVKSMAGHAMDSTSITELGLDGDRAFGVVDLDTGLVLTARRVPELLFARPHISAVALIGERPPAARPDIELPNGGVARDDAALSAWLERRVELRTARAGAHGTYEIAANDDRPDGEWMQWDGPEGVFHDSKRTRVSVIGEMGLGGWDVRRFRPNIVVSGDERGLSGHRVRIGTAELDIVKEIDRCVIVTRPQPGIDRDKSVLVQVHRHRGGHLGVGALVRRPGHIALGDAVLSD
jgi:uncharacterized protein